MDGSVSSFNLFVLISTSIQFNSRSCKVSEIATTMIKLEMLRTLTVVAETGNIRDAAARLMRTPSAISMTLTQLERQLGGPLFESDRKNNLTDLGRFVEQAALVLIRDHDRTLDLIAAYAQDRAGSLRLATVPSVAIHLLPALLKGFMSDRPNVNVDLVDTDTAQVGRLVESGQADLGLSGAPRQGALLSFQPLFRDPFKLVCGVSSGLAKLRRPVSWNDIAGSELIVNEASRVITAPEYIALASRARLTMRNMASLLAMVEMGMGITLLPSLACANLRDGIKALDLADGESWRVVGTVHRPGVTMSPLARAFHNHLAAHVPALLEPYGVTTLV